MYTYIYIHTCIYIYVYTYMCADNKPGWDGSFWTSFMAILGMVYIIGFTTLTPYTHHTPNRFQLCHVISTKLSYRNWRPHLVFGNSNATSPANDSSRAWRNGRPAAAQWPCLFASTAVSALASTPCRLMEML